LLPRYESEHARFSHRWLKRPKKTVQLYEDELQEYTGVKRLQAITPAEKPGADSPRELPAKQLQDVENPCYKLVELH
jgi:hypothetical protein